MVVPAPIGISTLSSILIGSASKIVAITAPLIDTNKGTLLIMNAAAAHIVKQPIYPSSVFLPIFVLPKDWPIIAAAISPKDIYTRLKTAISFGKK